jgi:hypothetical protein
MPAQAPERESLVNKQVPAEGLACATTYGTFTEMIDPDGMTVDRLESRVRPPAQRAQSHAAMRLIEPVAAAEQAVTTALARERAALKAGHLFAARAFHVRLEDAARDYIAALRRARATLNVLGPGSASVREALESRRLAFGSMLRIEFAALAAARAAAGEASAAASAA